MPWSDALTAVGTTLAVFVALALGFWTNGLSTWFWKPRLKASIDNTLPDCHVVDLTTERGQRKVSDQYYCRLRVTNRRWFCTSATAIELRLDRLWRIEPGATVEVEPFLPINLKWSHAVATMLTPERTIITPIIQRQVFRHCDLCFVDSRTPQDLEFCAEPRPNTTARVG